VSHAPSVVILGRSSNKIDNEYIKNLISSIDPEGVPEEFIYRVFVIDEQDNRFLMPENFYTKGIKYNNLFKTMSRFKTEHPIKTVEIVIDLLSVKDKLESEANEIFSQLPNSN
jgi:hypothetical protein